MGMDHCLFLYLVCWNCDGRAGKQHANKVQLVRVPFFSHSFLVVACIGGLSIFHPRVSVGLYVLSSGTSTPSVSAAVCVRSIGEAPSCLPRQSRLPKMAIGLPPLVKFILCFLRFISFKGVSAAQSLVFSLECKMSLSLPILPSSLPRSLLCLQRLQRTNEIPPLSFSGIGKTSMVGSMDSPSFFVHLYS